MTANHNNTGFFTAEYRWGIYLLSILAIVWGWSGAFGLDDAYITLHNARALLAGGDPTYGVDPLVGATSQVHLALVALGGLLGSLPLASFFIGLAAIVAYAVALDAAVRKAGLHGWRLAALVTIGLLVGTVPIHLLNGLETGLAMAAVAGMLALADDRRWLPVLAGIAPFIRPELGALAVILLLRQGSFRGIVIAALVAAPWLLWQFLATGQIVPGTMAAKVAFFAKHEVSAGQRIFTAVGAFGVAWLFPLLVGLSGRDFWYGSGFVVSVVAVAVVLIPGSLVWNDSRYLAPLVPALIVGIAKIASPGLRSALIVTLVIWTAVGLPRFLGEMGRAREEQQLQVDQFRAISLPAGTRILVHDAGEIAWAAPHLRLVDAVGLKTPGSVAFHRQFTRSACQWSQALDGIARATKVEYAVVLQVPFWDCVGRNLVQAGWVLEPQENLGNSRYRLFRLTPPSSTLPEGPVPD